MTQPKALQKLTVEQRNTLSAFGFRYQDAEKTHKADPNNKLAFVDMLTNRAYLQGYTQGLYAAGQLKEWEAYRVLSWYMFGEEIRKNA